MRWIGAALVFGAALLAGNDAEAFGFDPPIPIDPDTFVRPMLVGDMDGDGLADLVATASPPGSNREHVAIFHQLPDGGFGVPRYLAFGNLVSSSPDTIALGDVDGDGRPDIIVPNKFVVNLSAVHRLDVLLNRPEGYILTTIPREDYGRYGELLVDDLDGDGKLDLFVQGQSMPSVIRIGRGDGTFEPESPLPFPYPAITQPMKFADVDGDGRRDALYIVNGYAMARLRTPTGFSAGETALAYMGGRRGLHALHPGDFDGDGRLDLLAYRAFPGVPYVLLPQAADGKFRRALPGLAVDLRDAEVHDMDDDGRDDLLYFRNDHLQVQRGTAHGLAPPLAFPIPALFEFVAADLDGDGIGDVISGALRGPTTVAYGRPDAIEGDLAITVRLVDNMATVDVENAGAGAIRGAGIKVRIGARTGGLSGMGVPAGCHRTRATDALAFTCSVAELASGGRVSLAFPFVRDDPARADQLSADAAFGTSWRDLRADNDSASARLRVGGTR